MMGVCPVHTVSFYCVCVCTFALTTRPSCNREKRKNKKIPLCPDGTKSNSQLVGVKRVGAVVFVKRFTLKHRFLSFKLFSFSLLTQVIWSYVKKKSVCWEIRMFWESQAPKQPISTSMGSSLMPALFFIHHGVDLVNCALKTAPFAPLTLGSSVLSTEEHSSNGCKTPFSWNFPCEIWFQNRLSSP